MGRLSVQMIERLVVDVIGVLSLLKTMARIVAIEWDDVRRFFPRRRRGRTKRSRHRSTLFVHAAAFCHPAEQ
jgi:hypothetical protein